MSHSPSNVNPFIPQYFIGTKFRRIPLGDKSSSFCVVYNFKLGLSVVSCFINGEYIASTPSSRFANDEECRSTDVISFLENSNVLKDAPSHVITNYCCCIS